MKLVFIDEFKPAINKNSGIKTYGVAAVILDSAYYTNFKTGFIKEFKKLGWSVDIELKGRDVYSKNKFKNITQEQRIVFAEKLFKLSFSNTGKSKRISVFVAIQPFAKEINEYDIYIHLLSRILKKIERPRDKRLDNNLISCFLDKNDNVTKNITEFQLYKLMQDNLKEGWVVFEKPLFVSSSNLLPGVIFADFVSYFHQNFLDTRQFFNKNKSRFLELLDKTTLDIKEKDELNNHIINLRKRENSKRVLNILKEIIYVR